MVVATLDIPRQPRRGGDVALRPHAFGVAQGQLFPPGRGETSVGKMIDNYRYGEGLAYRDMADGALVIVIEGTRGT